MLSRVATTVAIAGTHNATQHRGNNMRDKNRTTIRTVIAPSIYPMMLVRSDNSCLCSDCARKQAKTLISDLRSGYETTLKYICMADTSETIYCDSCSQGVSAYE